MRPEGAESTLSLALILTLVLQAAASDPIGALLNTPAPPAASPPDLADPAAPARRIDDLDRPLNGAVSQGDYESRVLGAVARAQNLQGPLDGGWIVEDAAGAVLFRFQLVDRGFAAGAVEGVWSDQRVGGDDGRGFLSGVERAGTTVTMRFVRPGAATTLMLKPRAEGGYEGELTAAAPGLPDRRAAVVMRRP